MPIPPDGVAMGGPACARADARALPGEAARPPPPPAAGARPLEGGQRAPAAADGSPEEALAALLVRSGADAAAERIERAWRGAYVRLRVLAAGAGGLAWLRAEQSRVLQPHQRVGVRWLFERLASPRPRGVGAILADDPGLGKTLQSIAVITALVRGGATAPPARVLVVAPANNVSGWRAEFKRWACGLLVVDAIGEDAAGLSTRERLARLSATRRPGHLVVVISYESLAAHCEALGSGVDIAVADEAHKLRGEGELASAFRKASLGARRVLLSATPVPNNLAELYFLVDLAAPATLGVKEAFKEAFKGPIEAGRAHGAAWDVQQLGELAASDLAAAVRPVLLRRTNEELERGLPPKHTLLVCCRPTAVQRALHAMLQQDRKVKPFARLGLLRAIHTYPGLLAITGVAARGSTTASARLLAKVVPSVSQQPAERMLLSGKLQACARLMDALLLTTTDRIVVVAPRRAVLELVGDYARSVTDDPNIAFTLDGTVPLSKRKAEIKKFNSSSSTARRVCLLSIGLVEVRQGGLGTHGPLPLPFPSAVPLRCPSPLSLSAVPLGCPPTPYPLPLQYPPSPPPLGCPPAPSLHPQGLTLTGSNHTILLEPGWNPAVDTQACGRNHRPGQTRECYVYRLLATGTVDETIIERQQGKTSLMATVAHGKLPEVQSDDRALLFEMDEAGEESRLRARCAADSPYADRSQWDAASTADPEAVARVAGGGSAPWLVQLFGERLRQSAFLGAARADPGVRTVPGPAAAAEVGVTAEEMDEDGPTGEGPMQQEERTGLADVALVSFVFRSCVRLQPQPDGA